MNRYPIYIVSKGRWKNPLTHKALCQMGLNHHVIVEQHELSEYQRHLDTRFATVIPLPNDFKEQYDPFDNLGFRKPLGPGPARNYAWHHSEFIAKRHWVMDDNLEGFYRLNRNQKFRVECDAPIRAMEDFTDRYSNVVISGPNYRHFVKKTDPVPPFVKNTRIYSCLLIDNMWPFEWRGRYNEDTDLCLRALKQGHCTIQFNAFLVEKITTQRMKGGNTDAFYADEGTGPKSEMLARMHPDVARVADKFGRIHHHVDYRPFKRNSLKKIDPDKTYPEIDEYGMKTYPVQNT